MKPFIKYVGGKSDILDHFIDYFPKNIDTYYEPFLGGGSVLFRLLDMLENKKIKINCIKVNDNNKILIETYNNIKNNLRQFITKLDEIIENYTKSEDIQYEKRHKFIIDEKDINIYIPRGKSYVFYYYRQLYNETNDIFLKSVLFLFLNKTCFRGLYRESKNGFNVPFGNYKTPNFYNLENLENISNLLNKYNVQLFNVDYKDFLTDICSYDFVYLDPPYYDTFTKYIEGDFNKQDQVQLFNIINSFSCKFLLSNSKNEFIDELYNKFNRNVINCKRRINAKNPESIQEEFIVYN